MTMTTLCIEELESSRQAELEVWTRARGEANRIIAEHGYKVGNIDATILCQRPKLAPHIPAMRRNIADAFGLPVDAVSVKATTEEHLGFTGEGLGIAAHAVALIE